MCIILLVSRAMREKLPMISRPLLYPPHIQLPAAVFADFILRFVDVRPAEY